MPIRILGISAFYHDSAACLVNRISGRDPLGRKWKSRKESYWKPRPQPAFDPDRLQKQH
ncbi:MAG: hypothetical protein NT009_12200 [Proteobacteria bacterium]|nr:hypothetical protein [Pseudomonadota bacterium]